VIAEFKAQTKEIGSKSPTLTQVAVSSREVRGFRQASAARDVYFLYTEEVAAERPGHRGAPQTDRVKTAELFGALADWWHEATDFLSSPSEKLQHPAYQRIVALGEEMVPHIIADMQGRGGDWYDALREITDTDPVRPENVGRVPDMDNDWLEWARGRGYAP
jgi:hypothetical protein